MKGFLGRLSNPLNRRKEAAVDNKKGATTTTTTVKKTPQKGASKPEAPATTTTTITTTSTRAAAPQKKQVVTGKVIPYKEAEAPPAAARNPSGHKIKKVVKRKKVPANASASTTSSSTTTPAPVPAANSKSPAPVVGKVVSSTKKSWPPAPKAPPKSWPPPPKNGGAAASKSTSAPESSSKINRAPSHTKTLKSAATVNSHRKEPSVPGETPDEFAGAKPSKFKVSEYQFNGAATMESIGEKEECKGSIPKAIKNFKANPVKYTALQYQTSMVTDDWPADQHRYTLVHRKDTVNYRPSGVSPNGWMTILLQEYEALPAFPNNDLPKKDQYTDTVLATHQRRRLPPAVMPGRGMGIVDAPNIKMIGDIDPSDIHQGSVGDCWLLSGISSLAEFDGAIKKLFRKTKQLFRRPLDGPNMYTITLWDLSTWKEVDILIDERLCSHPTLKGQLLASKPSEDGELWVCYLEKALAAHCGGWDKITGGQCTHAWALMTGCKEQYTIRKNSKTGLYFCSSKFNPNTKQWAPSTNSPHDCAASVWPGRWPEVGGGGDGELTQEEVFMRLCAWDDVNFIMGAGRGSSQKKEAGMVDNHGYSVIECKNDVAGTDVDLIKVRNPWGSGEIENGYFDDDGPGWDDYPQIKRELNPVVADDGIFWVTKQEFFKLYDTIYLSASNMTEFLED